VNETKLEAIINGVGNPLLKYFIKSVPLESSLNVNSFVVNTGPFSSVLSPILTLLALFAVFAGVAFFAGVASFAAVGFMD